MLWQQRLKKLKTHTQKVNNYMTTFVDLWPIISGIIAVGAIGIAFRAEVLVRIKVLEEKVATVFNLLNSRDR